MIKKKKNISGYLCAYIIDRKFYGETSNNPRIVNWRFRLFLFLCAEGGRDAEGSKTNDEGTKIYKICIGGVQRPAVHDASGLSRQRCRIWTETWVFSEINWLTTRNDRRVKKRKIINQAENWNLLDKEDPLSPQPLPPPPISLDKWNKSSSVDNGNVLLSNAWTYTANRGQLNIRTTT